MSNFEFMWFRHGTGEHPRLFIGVRSSQGRYRVWSETWQTKGMLRTGERRISAGYKDTADLIRSADGRDCEAVTDLAGLLRRLTNLGPRTIHDAAARAHVGISAGAPA